MLEIGGFRVYHLVFETTNHYTYLSLTTHQYSDIYQF
jgi:hypothetical protein